MLSDKEDSDIDFGSRVSGVYEIPDIYLEEYLTDNNVDDKSLNDVYFDRDLRADSRNTDSKMYGLLRNRVTNYSPYGPDEGRSSYVYGGPDSRLLESVDLPVFESQNTHIYDNRSSNINSRHSASQQSNRYKLYSRGRTKRSTSPNVYSKGGKKLIEIHVEPLRDRSQVTNSPSRSESNPVWEGTHFLLTNYQAQSRISSASSLRSTDSPIKSAPNLSLKKAQTELLNATLHKKDARLKTFKQIDIKGKRDLKNTEEKFKDTETKNEDSETKSTGSLKEFVKELSRQSSLECSEFNLEDKKRRNKKKVPNNSLLRIVKAAGTCDNEDCQFCQTARFYDQNQV